MGDTLFGNDSRIACVSMWRPWAGWVAAGLKTIETRLHSRFAGLKGQRVGIHAARRWDDAAEAAARPYLPSGYVLDPLDTAHDPGHVLCTALVVDARWLTAGDSAAALVDCGAGRRFGLVLSDVEALPRSPETIAVGRQGKFYVRLPGEGAGRDD